MDFPQRAVFFLEEDSSLPAHSKPLMLEAVLFCPILKWMSDKLLADGVQRFFAAFNPLRCLVDRCRSAVYNLSYRIAKHSKGEYG